MQYQDGHISTCFNQKILVIYIYCIYACASWSLFVIYLLVISHSLLIVHLFCSLFNYLFCFHFHRFFAYLVFKREKNNSDPEPCSGISIPLTEEVPRCTCYLFKYTTPSFRVNKHHTADSTDFVLV
jgi:hypothetical protein